MSKCKFYTYLTSRIDYIVSLFCDNYGLATPDYDYEGSYVEGDILHVEIEVGDDTLVLQNNLEYIVDCKNDKELYEEIKGMFIDTADWFKKNNRLDDLVNANEVFAKREEVFWGE